MVAPTRRLAGPERPRREDLARYFVALRPGPRARAGLAAFARELAARFGGRAVAAADVHLTLAFIGQAPRACEAPIARVLAALPPAEPLALRRAGTFDGRLLWVAPDDPPAPWLVDLAGDLRSQLDRLGVAFDRKRLRPHVTLVRGARGADRAALARLELPRSARGLGQARAWLVESTLLAAGSRYRWVGAPPDAFIIAPR